MKELYNEYFHIPKHGKIRDKVMLIRTAITTIVMIVCLAAMSLTAYAYFSYNVTSGSNIIKAANFEADVSISVTDANGDAVTVNKVDSKTHTAVLEAGITYFITLDESENSTAKTGFCVVTAVGCPDTYHTQQLGADTTVAGGSTDKITFQLEVTAETTVTFLSHWGTSSHYAAYKENGEADKLYITNANTGDNAVKMVINGVINSVSESDEEKETTSDETTETETTPTEVVYTVQSGDTLSEIAKQYSTTVARIVAYNGLENPDDIKAGQQLKIPPADYEVPADTTEQTTTTTTPETTAPETTTTPETTTPETTTPAETTTPPETSVTDPVDTTAPAETTTSTETTGTPETSAPAETTESVETTSDETEATETTAASTDNAE